MHSFWVAYDRSPKMPGNQRMLFTFERTDFCEENTDFNDCFKKYTVAK